MKKLQSKIKGMSLDTSRNSNYYELNSDIQETKISSSRKSSVQSSAMKRADDSYYSAFESSDLLNDVLSTLKIDTPHMFYDSDSAATLVMIIGSVPVEMVFGILCQPESFIQLSPHIVCASFKENSAVMTKDGEKTKIKVDMTVSKKRLFFWDKMESMEGYFLLPLAPNSSPPKHTTSLKIVSPHSSTRILEFHTQDSKGGEVRYIYSIDDHPDGTKVTCKVTEERRVILQSSRATSSSGKSSGVSFDAARQRIYRFFSKSKISLIGNEQKAFLNNFRDHIKDLTLIPTRLVV